MPRLIEISEVDLDQIKLFPPSLNYGNGHLMILQYSNEVLHLKGCRCKAGPVSPNQETSVQFKMELQYNSIDVQMTDLFDSLRARCIDLMCENYGWFVDVENDRDMKDQLQSAFPTAYKSRNSKMLNKFRVLCNPKGAWTAEDNLRVYDPAGRHIETSDIFADRMFCPLIWVRGIRINPRDMTFSFEMILKQAVLCDTDTTRCMIPVQETLESSTHGTQANLPEIQESQDSGTRNAVREEIAEANTTMQNVPKVDDMPATVEPRASDDVSTNYVPEDATEVQIKSDDCPDAPFEIRRRIEVYESWYDNMRELLQKEKLGYLRNYLKENNIQNGDILIDANDGDPVL